MPIHARYTVSTIVLAVALSACNRTEIQDTTPPASPKTVVRVEVTETGFTPDTVNVRPDEPTVLAFVRTADPTCVTDVVFPESGIRHELPLNEIVRITVQPDAGNPLTFACPMDMHRGSVGVANAEREPARPSSGLPDAGILEIAVDERGFHPSRLQIPTRESTILRFTRTAERTCNTSVVLPALGAEHYLPVNKPVDVRVSPDSPGEIQFFCPMEMAGGVIEVRQGDNI